MAEQLLPEKPWRTPEGQLDPAVRAELEHVRLSPIIARWGNQVRPYRRPLELMVRASGITGALYTDGPANGEALVENIDVDQRLRGHRIGSRLLQSFTAEMKRAGAHVLVGHLNSPEGLFNRAQTFGDENVTYFDVIDGDSGGDEDPAQREILALTREQALDLLRRRLAIDPDATLGAAVNLDIIDTSQWELPEAEEPGAKSA